MRLWPFKRRERPDPLIEMLIKPPVYRFTGHDEAMEQRARERNKEAERVRLAATRIDTQDVRASKLHRVS